MLSRLELEIRAALSMVSRLAHSKIIAYVQAVATIDSYETIRLGNNYSGL